MGRTKKAFSLYLRHVKLPGKKTLVKRYYYRTYDEHGLRTVGRSTGASTVSDAEDYCRKLQAAKQLVSGPAAPDPAKIPPTLSQWAERRHWWIWGDGAVPLCEYLRGQVNRSDESEPGVSRRYADDALRDLKAWILPYHGEKRLDKITPNDIEALMKAWQDGKAPHGESEPRKPISRKSINNKASIYRIMLTEAERLRVIPENPWIRVKGFKAAEHPKGILMMEEAARLLNPATIKTIWNANPLYHAANLTASLTGLRVGEILALKTTDLFPDHLHVAKSWAIKYGEGPTKTRRTDDIPIPRFLYDTINHFLEWEGYIFSFAHGEYYVGERPCTANRIEDALKAALAEIGIDEAQRKERNVTFHSWRAFANTYFQGRGISGEKVREITRHKTEKMTQHYSQFSLEHFRDVAEAQEALVANFTESKENT